MRKLQGALMIILISISGIINAAEVNISSVKELAKYASKSGNTITMSPGVYQLTDYINEDSMRVRHDRKEFQYITFSGNSNTFNLDGVEIEVDTKLRIALNPPIHSDEFLITGGNNTFKGLTIRCKGEGISPGGTVLQIAGKGNVLKEITLYVAGAYPYGYGDLFGKGKAKETVIKHYKHSGLLVTGDETKLYDCKLYNRSFGHCFFVQRNAENVYFENCYAEGAIRSTDDILAETSGPAFDVNFRTWTQNRDGEYVVTPGYMKSLCEDGFRTYGPSKNIFFKNCTAKNTRAGFELRMNGVRLENCTTIGTERAYWVGDDAIVKNCKGDANYVREFINKLPPVEQTEGFHMGSDGYIWGREFVSTEPDPVRELEVEKHWYKYMLWGRLGYNPNLSNEFFEKAMQQRFPGKPTQKLQAVWTQASKIIPAINRAHWHDWDYQWSVEACSGRQYYHAITEECWKPGGIVEADEIQKHADYVLKELSHLQKNEGDKTWQRTLGDMEAMAHLGNYYAEKLRAAERKESKPKQAIIHLKNALSHWEKYAEIGQKQYKPQLLSRAGTADWQLGYENAKNDLLLLEKKTEN